MRLLVVFLLFACCMLVPAHAERLISQVSNDTIEITSSFDGERMNFFGAIVPEAGSDQRYVDGPFHVVVVVLGPTVGPARELVRRAAHVLR